jgi:hypothetical protein
MARQPLRSYQNQMMNYGIGKMFAENKPVTRGMMAEAELPEDPTTYLDNLKRLKMVGGLSGINQPVRNKLFDPLPKDIAEATKQVVQAGDTDSIFEPGTPADFVPFVIPEGANVTRGKSIEPGTSTQSKGELGSKVIPSQLKGGRGDVVEEPGERAAFFSQFAADKAISNKMDKDNAIEDAFKAGMEEFIKSARDAKAPGDTKVRDLEDYKKEFAEATGLDVSGKVDKSQALMAFGLALMQNRAGKGFNVGRMLREVGKAGEAAMPELAAAKQEARENAAAAGKYALEMRSSDRDKATAAAKAAQQRGKYYIMPKSEGASGFVSVIDEAKPEFLNATELNALVTNPDFSSQYDVITGDRFAEIVDKVLETPEAQEIYKSAYKSTVTLFGDDEGISNLFSFDVVNPEPNLAGQYPSKMLNPQKEGQIVKALGSALDDIDALDTAFAGAIASIEDGASTLPSQVGDYFVQLADRLGVDVAADTPTARLQKFLTRFQAENASDILGEAGKTLSDNDRRLVAEIVGDLPSLFEGSPDILKSKLLEMKKKVIDKKRRQIYDGFRTLDGYTPGRDYSPIYEDDDWTEEDQKVLDELRKTQGANA